jgi:CheY-like chemotaxis protein
MVHSVPVDVLIVEDDGAIRDALAEILQDEGYRVAGASNGAEAMAYLRHAPRPCLILLDLMMPVMDGWQFRAVQQRDPGLAPIPTVVLSADGNVAEKARAIDAADYLKKPVQLQTLLSTVERFCS